MKLATPMIALFGITLFTACGDEAGTDAGTPRDATTGDSGVDAGSNADAGFVTTCVPTTLATPGCGNDPTGTWVYRSACGLTSGAELQQLCAGVDIQATSHQVTGSLVLTATNYTLDTTDVTDITAGVPSSCSAPVGGCPGVQAALRANFNSATCTAAAAGCTCMINATLSASETGTYTTAAGVLTTTPSGGGPAGRYNYCVEGGVLHYREATDTVVWVLSP